MESKPFTIRPPLQILQAYGNNLSRVAEAAANKHITDLEAGLAAQEYRKWEAAAQSAKVPTQTYVQQLFNPQAPPAPMGGIGMPAPPPMEGAPAGLGATPEAAQMQAPMPVPEMPAPEMPQPEMGMAMGGMVPPYAAGGGLSDVPIPSGMFDEPDNGGYADGGLVAFARGGYNDFHKAVIAQESGGRYGIPNAQGSGAMGIGQLMPDTARALAKRLGLPYSPALLAGDDEKSRKYQDTLTSAATKEAWDYAKGNPQLAAQYYHAGPDKEGWGPKTQKYGMDVMGRLGMEGTPMPREADTNTAAGRAISLEDAIAMSKGMFSNLPREELERAKAAAREELDPDTVEKQAKYDTGEALATLGFGIMDPQNYKGEGFGAVLGSIGAAAKAAMGVYGASRKERKATKNEAIRNLMALEDVDRKTAASAVEVGIDVYKSGLTAEAAQRALAFQEKELTSRENTAKLDRNAQLAIASLRTSNPTEFESAMTILAKGTPEQKKMLREYYGMKRQQGGIALPGDEGDASSSTGPWSQYQ